MTNGIDSGIDLISHNVGELPPGKTYLVSGERGAAKTTFALQFLYQGLKDRQTCAFVCDQAPKGLVQRAELLGLDFSPYLRSGKLLIYELARKEGFGPAELFQELEEALGHAPLSRFAIEGLGQAAANGDPAWPSAAVSFLGKLGAMKTTSFVTLVSPAPASAVAVKDALEETAAGSFLLKNGGDEHVKSFSVRRMTGGRAEGEYRFSVDPGHGIVEIMSAGGISFPRHDESNTS